MRNNCHTSPFNLRDTWYRDIKNRASKKTRAGTRNVHHASGRNACGLSFAKWRAHAMTDRVQENAYVAIKESTPQLSHNRNHGAAKFRTDLRSANDFSRQQDLNRQEASCRLHSFLIPITLAVYRYNLQSWSHSRCDRQQLRSRSHQQFHERTPFCAPKSALDPKPASTKIEPHSPFMMHPHFRESECCQATWSRKLLVRTHYCDDVNVNNLKTCVKL